VLLLYKHSLSLPASCFFFLLSFFFPPLSGSLQYTGPDSDLSLGEHSCTVTSQLQMTATSQQGSNDFISSGSITFYIHQHETGP